MAGSLTYPDAIIIRNSASNAIAQSGYSPGDWIYVGDYRRFVIEIHKVSGSLSLDVYETNDDSPVNGDTTHPKLNGGSPITGTQMLSPTKEGNYPIRYIMFNAPSGAVVDIFIHGERFFARSPKSPAPPSDPYIPA